MPKEIQKILVIGSGPVGSAQLATSPAETDLTCRALTAAGKTVILVTSDPNVFRNTKIATEFYVAPLTADFVSQVIRRERPDGIIASSGGQIALNIIRQITASGLLRQLNISVLGTGMDAINRTEDGEALRKVLKNLSIPTPESVVVQDVQKAAATADAIGYPVLIRRGQTRGIAKNATELANQIQNSIGEGRILIERAIHRFKAVELVAVRDTDGNNVLLGTIEDFDPVGVNPANTIVVTPAQSLTDRDRSNLRRYSFKALDALDIRGVATISFALDPNSDDWYMLKVKIGLAWGPSLIARATGYPVAGVNTAIALGQTLTEVKIGADKRMVAAHEPGVDAVIARFPTFPHQMQNGAKLGPQLVAGGAIVTAGRTLEATLIQGLYSLTNYDTDVLPDAIRGWDEDTLTAHIIKANALRPLALWSGIERGYTINELVELTNINTLFIAAIANLVAMRTELRPNAGDLTTLHDAKRLGFADKTVARHWDITTADVRALRLANGITPTYKAIDGMGFIKPDTPTYYATYEQENESYHSQKPRVIVVEPNASAPWLNLSHEAISSAMLAAIANTGRMPVLVGSTPRPLVYPGVKQYLVPAVEEHILDIVGIEAPQGVICQTAGTEGSRIAQCLKDANVPVLGSSMNAQQADANAILAAFSDDDRDVIQGSSSPDDDVFTHLSVDAISDGTDIAVLGVINSLEQNASRAGTVLAVTPPRKGVTKLTSRLIQITKALSQFYEYIGFVHLDAVVSDDTIKVTFVGPSASATIPFLAKTLQLDCVDIAARVLLGETLAELGIAGGQLPQTAGVHVLLPVFRSGLTVTGQSIPEIVQTGLVMGTDLTLGKALIKAFAAAHAPLPDHGTVLLNPDEDSERIDNRLTALGFQTVGLERAQHLNGIHLIVMNQPDPELRRRATAHNVPLINDVAANAILQIYEARAFALEPLPTLMEPNAQ